MAMYSRSNYVAFGDESYTSDPTMFQTCLFAAVIAESNRLDELRLEAAALRLPGHTKSHWHDDTERRRDVVVSMIRAMDIEGLIVVRESGGGEPVERRRRKTLQRFLTELERGGYFRLTLESRGLKPDQRDRHLLDTLRSQKAVEQIRLDHVPGPAEPLLGVADAVCGAHNAHRRGNSRWWERIQSRFELIEIPVP